MMGTHKVQPCRAGEFHGVECLETDVEYGFFKTNNDRRPGHAIWIRKEKAKRLYQLFTGKEAENE